MTGVAQAPVVAGKRAQVSRRRRHCKRLIRVSRAALKVDLGSERPKIALAISVVGALKATELVRLVASPRNSSFTRSLTATRWRRDASNWK